MLSLPKVRTSNLGFLSDFGVRISDSPRASVDGDIEEPLELQPRDQQFALEDHFFGQVWIKFYEQFVLGKDLPFPFFDVDFLYFLELSWNKAFHSGEVH